MTDLDFEHDQLLKLVTDALAAGPGKPAWQEALAHLQQAGAQSADEWSLLMRAREHLESGKNFRTIRGGDGFTRQLMDALDATPASATEAGSNYFLLAGCAAAAILTLAAIVTLIWRGGQKTGGDANRGVLINTVSSVDFDGPMPGDWEKIGGMPLTINRNALLPDSSVKAAATGGGIAWKTQIAAGEPFSFSAVYRLPHVDSDLVAELFVSDDPIFDGDTAITPHELVWLCQSRSVSVISPSGRVLLHQELPADTRNALQLRLTVNGSHVTVEQSNKSLWDGPNELDPAKPRAIGLRFIRTGSALPDDCGFTRLRINMRQTP